MKRKTVRLLCLLLLTALGNLATVAQVVDPLEVMVCDPAEGPVESLQSFTITFGDMPVVVKEDSIPTLEKGGGATVPGRMRAGADGTSVIVEFDENFTLSGQYYLNLPGWSIIVRGQPLLPLTLRFSIAGTVASFYEQITIDPAEGEVESLQYFNINLPQYVTDVNYDNTATLTNVVTGKSHDVNLLGVAFRVIAYLDGEVTEPGEYNLTIPAGTIDIIALGEPVNELNFHYTIAAAPTFIPGDVDGDSLVNIADVTALIDILLSGATAPAAADVDGDSLVNIADVTALIDMLLSGH